MSIAPEEERFAENTIIMAQAIHDSITRLYNAGYKTVNPLLVELAVGIIARFDKHHLIQGFINNSHQLCWDAIKRRDEKFIVANAGEIFKYLPTDKVNLFKDLFETKDDAGNSVVSESLKEQLWDLFDAMIKISIKYIHNGRKPCAYAGENGLVNAYTHPFFDEVDLAYHVGVWGVKLEFKPNV